MKYLYAVITILICTLSQAQNYVDSVQQLRISKTAELINPESGTLTDEEIDHFKGLDFFLCDKNYRITCKFEKNIGKKFKMPTSTERKPIYRRYGYVYFKIDGQECKLTVYQNIELSKQKAFKNNLFIPFRDATSGNESYGGGRYIDVEIPMNDELVIDFNLCYNPYCAYSPRYSCPIPPAENTLQIAIKAGEKVPLGHE